MKKKLAALSLALTLLTVPAAAFTDVDEGLYYAAPIAWAVEQGITTGTTETTFSPDVLCTRGQIITFLWRAAGSPEPQSMDSPYADVVSSMNQEFYKAILWAGETGIIGPDSLDADGCFAPGAPCTRAVTMGFLWRYAGSPAAGDSAIFTDVSPEANYAQAVSWAVEAGITEGTAETTFSPDEPCTRGQIAAFLYRCLNDSGHVPESPPDTAPAESGAASVPEEPDEDFRPLRTLTGVGKAYSLGLDGSEFTSEEVYEAEVSVDIYSGTEAVLTIRVPFPLFQACCYTVRFDDSDNPGEGYLFTYLRWDEAFADIIPWEGEHYIHRFTNTTGRQSQAAVIHEPGEDDRMGGVVTWRVRFPEGRGGFSFNRLEGYQLSCEVNCTL